MVQDYNGTTVVDAAGEPIGTVERSYVDDAGTVRVVRVKLGKLFAKHRLVPVDAARRETDRLSIPYTKQMVEDSPDVDADNTLEPEGLERVRTYYAGSAPRQSSRAPDEEQAEERNPVAEERRAVVREVPPASGRGAAVSTVDDAGEVGRIRDRGDVIEIPIVEEELVKRPVVKEILRVKKSTITEHQDVTEDLRKEEVEIDQEGDVAIRTDEQRRS